jgi:hypothetical protein
MSDQQPRKLTAEVQRALDAITPKPPPPPAPPAGHQQYFIAIGEHTVLRGTAPIATIAAQLRMLADQIESS